MVKTTGYIRPETRCSRGREDFREIPKKCRVSANALVAVSKTKEETVGYVLTEALKSGPNERVVGADFQICRSRRFS